MEDYIKEIEEMEKWFASPRFKEIIRLYSAEEVVEQRGTIYGDYPIAAKAAEEFYQRLRELFEAGKQITTFGPYSPGQAVAIKRMGIEALYLGGWATSAKGSTTEDPGPDLASYPLSQVPNEAAVLIRALLAADKNQKFARMRMTEEELRNTPEIDYRPFLIADADTGHGGEAHVRNLIRRFVEVGVPGYHIEDQKPGVKKCGHQAGKVLVAQDEQIKRLNSARFQLDVMKVPGIIVARTDAEAATYIDSIADERDHAFILGATNIHIPSYKVTYLAILKHFYEKGVKALNGHLLYRISDRMYEEAYEWLRETKVLEHLDKCIADLKDGKFRSPENALDAVVDKFLDVWQMEAELKTYGQAIADLMQYQLDEGNELEMSIDEWKEYVKTVSF
ncbi:MAG: isocitrate lyase, partial [Calditrichaeota bacterium]